MKEQKWWMPLSCWNMLLFLKTVLYTFVPKRKKKVYGKKKLHFWGNITANSSNTKVCPYCKSGNVVKYRHSNMLIFHMSVSYLNNSCTPSDSESDNNEDINVSKINFQIANLKLHWLSKSGWIPGKLHGAKLAPKFPGALTEMLSSLP